MSSIDRYNDTILSDTNLVIISVADVNYDTLPSKIKEKVDMNKYCNLPEGETITLNIDKATILIK
jgi:hypothetical protein